MYKWPNKKNILSTSVSKVTKAVKPNAKITDHNDLSPKIASED